MNNPNFSGIIGHERVQRRLWSSLQRGVLHHAYLFEGPQGVGKTQVALWLAQAANCTGASARPCGRCPACAAIRAGTYTDVIQLTPGSDRATPTIPVAAVREVVRKLSYHRYGSKRRVVLIDPAEAMSPSAANALLKSLEEPPEGTGFILITQRTAELLPTVVSRCQRVRFGALSQDALAEWLNAKGIEQAQRIARLAMGCPGRALSLDAAAIEARHSLGRELEALLQGPLGELFAWTQRLCTGARTKYLPQVEAVFAWLEDLLRDVVVYGSGGPVALMNPEAETLVARWTERLWPTGIWHCAQALADARDRLRSNVSGRTVLDALLCRVATELGQLPA